MSEPIMSKPNLNLPEPDYERDISRYIRVYKTAMTQIIAQVTTLSTHGKGSEDSRQQMESILSQITVILRQLDDETKKWTEETIRKAFMDGQARTILALGEAKTLSEAASLAAFSMLAKDTVETLIADTYNDLLLATQNTERKIKQLVRETVADQMRMKAIEATGRVTTSKAIVETLTKQGLSDRVKAEGFVGIVDKAGRKWNLATYAELRRSNRIFHPNCKHKATPIRDLCLLPEAVRKKHEDKEGAAKEALKN